MRITMWFYVIVASFEKIQNVDLSEGTMEKEKRLLYVIEPDNSSEIMERIFRGYDKHKRPYYKVKPVTIQVSIGVTSISHISEEDMDFDADIYLRQFWHDPRLAYGKNNKSIIIQGENLDKMWIPDTYIDNSRKSTVNKDTRTAIIFADGSIFYTFKSTNNLLSRMNFLKYPMDEQTLQIHFYSYAYDVNKIILKWKSGILFNKQLAAFVIEKVTLLESNHTYITGIFSSLSLEFKIRRRLGYFMLQFYFPCVLCAVVSWLPFWMDRYEIGDRVSLGITTLLTEVFLSQYINSAMPQVSYVKAADEFLLASFIFILMALIESVVVYNVRLDVRQKEKLKQRSVRQEKQQWSIRQNKPQDDDAFIEELPLSIINLLQKENKRKDSQQVEACESSDQQSSQVAIMSRKRDLALCVDRASRFVFPTSYVIFVVYFFGRYVL